MLIIACFGICQQPKFYETLYTCFINYTQFIQKACLSYFKKNLTMKKTIIHVAPFPIQNMGKGKGRVSTYLPLKGLVESGYDNIYITNSPYASHEDSEPGITVVKIADPFTKTCFA